MRAIKHPGEAALALHAGGDLGPIARWRAARHLRQCRVCREELAAFQGVRRLVAEMPSEPEIPWNPLAAEMRANIRLGLAAGECAGGNLAGSHGATRFTGFRAALALASLMMVVAAGLMLRHLAAPAGQTVLEATADGIQVRRGGESLGMKHGAGTGNVSYSASAQGSIGESYVDPVTGDVTMTRVSW